MVNLTESYLLKTIIGEYVVDGLLNYLLPNALLTVFQALNEQKIDFANSLLFQKDVQMLSNLNWQFVANNQYDLVYSFSQNIIV